MYLKNCFLYHYIIYRYTFNKNVPLCAGAYGLKALGLTVGGRLDPEVAERWHLEILVVPILAALIAVQSFSTGHRLVLDARAGAACRGRSSSGAARRSSSSRWRRRPPPRGCGWSSDGATGLWLGYHTGGFGELPHERRATLSGVACRRR